MTIPMSLSVPWLVGALLPTGLAAALASTEKHRARPGIPGGRGRRCCQPGGFASGLRCFTGAGGGGGEPSADIDFHWSHGTVQS